MTSKLDELIEEIKGTVIPDKYGSVNDDKVDMARKFFEAVDQTNHPDEESDYTDFVISKKDWERLRSVLR